MHITINLKKHALYWDTKNYDTTIKLYNWVENDQKGALHVPTWPYFLEMSQAAL